MHRVEELYAAAGGFFQLGPPGTRLGPDWHNSVQEEICTVISAAGLPLLSAATDTRDQLYQALNLLYLAGTVDGHTVIYSSPVSNGTWQPSAAGLKIGDTIEVFVIGPGGGGGGANNSGALGGAAGALGWHIHTLSAADLSTGIVLTVGSGGAGGASGHNSGVAGTTTSFGTYVVATGGQFGYPQDVGVEYTLGGICSGANIANINGSWGLPIQSTVLGGAGGNSPLGGGGGRPGKATVVANGSPGTAPGAGGGAGGWGVGAVAGGDGAHGAIIIRWYGG